MSFKRLELGIVTPEQLAADVATGKTSLETLRDTYERYAKVARERIRKLEVKGSGGLEIVRDYKNRFPYMKELGRGTTLDKTLLYDALSEVSHFLNLKQSTLGGYHAQIAAAEETFSRHYGDELPPMSRELFGELMRSIKSRANAEAYYRGWKKAYRALASAVQRKGLSEKDLVNAIKNDVVTIGPKGGIWGERVGAKLRKNWNSMGE